MQVTKKAISFMIHRVGPNPGGAKGLDLCWPHLLRILLSPKKNVSVVNVSLDSENELLWGTLWNHEQTPETLQPCRPWNGVRSSWRPTTVKLPILEINLWDLHAYHAGDSKDTVPVSINHLNRSLLKSLLSFLFSHDLSLSHALCK